MLHARAMPRVGEGNSEGGRPKTPDFGLVEAGKSHCQACTNTQSCTHARTCRPMPAHDPMSHFYGNGARWKGRRRGRSGERTGNLWDRKSEGTLKMPRHLDSSLPVTVMPKARPVCARQIFILRCQEAIMARVAPPQWLRHAKTVRKGSQQPAPKVNHK